MNEPNDPQSYNDAIEPEREVPFYSMIEDYRDMHDIIEYVGRDHFFAFLRELDEEFGYDEVLDLDTLT